MVGSSDDDSGLDDATQVLAQAQQEVRELVGRWSGGASGEHRLRGVGTGADGMVRVVAADGRVERVELDPRVMRMPSQSLAEAFVQAVNAAIDDVRAAYAAALPNVDLEALAAELDQVEEMGTGALRRYAESIDEAAAQYRRLGRA
jgi:hypothetical protein